MFGAIKAKITGDTGEGIMAEAIVNVKGSRVELENLLPQFMDWSVEAAKEGDDAYSEELLAEMAILYDFIADLKAIERQIRKEARIAKALDNLSDLAKALKGCTALFKSGSRIGAIGKNLVDFKKHIGKGMSDIKDIRTKMTKYGNIQPNDIFSEAKPADHPKVSSLRDEREKRLIALEAEIPAVTRPNEAVGDINSYLDEIIEDENSKP